MARQRPSQVLRQQIEIQIALLQAHSRLTQHALRLRIQKRIVSIPEEIRQKPLRDVIKITKSGRRMRLKN